LTFLSAGLKRNDSETLLLATGILGPTVMPRTT
jgi:hypothetical protein